MTNLEKFRDEIIIACASGSGIALIGGKVDSCMFIEDCILCDFHTDNGCREEIEKWLRSECKDPEIDWSKVPVDAHILVKEKDDIEWKRRHFAKYENGKVYAFSDGYSSWSVPAEAEDELLDWECAKLADEVVE